MTGRLHVAQVLPSFEWGGTQALVVLFAEHARRLDVDLTVIAFAACPHTPYATKLRDHGARVVYLEGRSVLDPVRIFRFARMIGQDRIDLVHANLMRPNTVAPLAGALARCPVLAGLHTLPTDAGRRARWRAKFETLAVRKSAGIISCADSIAKAQAARFAPAEIQVLSNPAPYLKVPRKAGSLQMPLRFIAIGRLSYEKGYDILLEAAAGLNAKGHDFTLVIVGDGHLRAELEAKSARLNLIDKVTFAGARDDIPEMLDRAEVYVSPSRFEGLSIALLEAMASGLAVIATPVGDTTDLVTADVGVLVPPDDSAALQTAMERMIMDRNAVMSCGVAAQDRIKETRAPGPWAEQLVAIYRNTIATYAKRI